MTTDNKKGNQMDYQRSIIQDEYAFLNEKLLVQAMMKEQRITKAIKASSKQ